MLTLLNMPKPETKPEIKEMLYLTSPSAVESCFGYKQAYGEDCKAAAVLLYEIIKNKEPYKIRDLKITGTDLIKHGITGEDIGKTLEKLRRAVILDPALNTRKRLEERLYIMKQTT